MKKKKKKILNCVLKIGIEHVPKTICISIFEKLITTPLAFFFFFFWATKDFHEVKSFCCTSFLIKVKQTF